MEKQILYNYPRLQKKDLQSVFHYILDIMKDGIIYNDHKKYKF